MARKKEECLKYMLEDGIESVEYSIDDLLGTLQLVSSIDSIDIARFAPDDSSPFWSIFVHFKNKDCIHFETLEELRRWAERRLILRRQFTL